MNLARRVLPHLTPANSIVNLPQYLSAPPFDHQFHYQPVVGNINFFKKITQYDISYETHQISWFCKDPRCMQGATIEHLYGYLRRTCNKMLILDKNCSNSFEGNTDAYFCRNWYRLNTSDDPLTAKSRSGYVLLYIGCPIVWVSKLQMAIALYYAKC